MEQYGEGNFRLGDVKQIRTTADFTSMDKDIIGCQTDTSYENCVTDMYLEALINECSCLPYSLQNYTNDMRVRVCLYGSFIQCF